MQIYYYIFRKLLTEETKNRWDKCDRDYRFLSGFSSDRFRVFVIFDN